MMSARMLLPFLLAAAATANCVKDYTCCAQWDFFIPVMVTCVEDEPSGKDNCGRNDQSKVPAWARLETPEWRWKGVCTGDTRKVTRAQIEAKEKKEKEFNEEYKKYCTDNAAHCSATETCYYNKTHLSGNGATSYSGVVQDMGAACVCEFAGDDKEYARASKDGTGACVECQPGPNGTKPYEQFVQKSDEPGAKSFHNGEFACAFGPKKSAESVIV